MSEDQLDDVLKHVRMDRRDFVRRAVLGSAFAVPVIASFPMGTALAEGSQGCATGNGSPGYTAERKLAQLATFIQEQNLGPGKSLADKVATARQLVYACDFEAAQAVLRDFIRAVEAQRGKKINAAAADQLVQLANEAIALLSSPSA